jgi:large repetitive protein
LRSIRSNGVTAIAVLVGAVGFVLMGAAPASALFEPQTTITNAPPDPSNSSSASFSFASSIMGSSFDCQLDGGGFAGCNSPRTYSNLQDGSHTFEVYATDQLFPPTPDPTPATYTWTVDTTGPDASIDSGPSGTTNSTSANFTFSASGASGFECSRDGGAFNSCTSPENYTVGEGSHSFSVRALDSLGNAGQTATRNWTVDTTGPTTNITNGPSGTTNQTSVHFTFSSEAGASFECNRDGAGFSACSSPQDYTVSEGFHSFAVRATDSAGNLGPTVTRNWNVVTTGPTTTITAGPLDGSTTNQASVHITFSAPGAASYECNRDGAGFSSCSSPQDYTVSDGSHSFSVRALDSLGNTGATATRNWTVDTTGPTTDITQGPEDGSTTNQTDIHFKFSASGAASFQCDSDGSGFNPCSSPYNYTVGEGSHSFSVRALDSLGNPGPAATRNWTVDTTGPTTNITSGPAEGSTTNQTSVNFTFSASGAAGFQCSRDGGAFSSCTSPENYTVTEGSHSFSVRALDTLGNIGPAASRSWTVVTTGPTTTITSGPAQGSATNQTTVQFTFSAPGASSFECNHDGAGFSTCSSPHTYNVGEGSHSFSVRAIDGLGNVGAPASRSWTVDSTGPAVSINSGPSGTVTVGSAIFTFSSGASDLARYECQVDSAGFSTCSAPVQYTVGEGTHTFYVRAVDSVGNTGSVATRTWTVDTSPPDVSITSTPPNPSPSTSASFSFTSTAADLSGFECKLDGAAFAGCTTGKSYSSLTTGSHTFQVHAIDSAGNTSGPASYTWIVDTGAPDVTITGGPQGTVNTTTASFDFSSTAPDLARYECRIESTSFATCSSPANYGVGEGTHTFFVRAVDTAGNVGTAASQSWTVDVTAPTTQLSSGPGAVTNQTTATFTYSSNESGAGFQCHLDSAPWGSCPSPKSYTGIGDGTHTFYVRAIDVAGNIDQSEATYTWTVITSEPETTITSGPAGPIAQNSAQFGFASEQGATFECSLDPTGSPANSWGGCSSPKTYTSLADGPWTFSVRATNIAGTTDSTPATRSFSVDATAPTATITGFPPSPTNAPTENFFFTANEANATFKCSMDTAVVADFTPCASPASYPLGDGQSDGSHTFRVFAVDQVGNAGAVVSRSVVIDTQEPDTTITSPPHNTTADGQPTFTFSGTGSPVRFECQIDGSAFATCTSPYKAPPLTNAPHTFAVRSVDAAGNVDPFPASESFTVETLAPDTILDGGPTGAPCVDPCFTTDATPTFSFHADKANSTFQCELTGPGQTAGFSACTNPRTYSISTDGLYTFSVRAVGVGGTDQSPATKSFTLDRTAPTTTISAGPVTGTTVNSNSTTFSFTSNETGASFQCRLDAAAYAPCVSPVTYTQLAEGSHTFRVFATDRAGNPDTSQQDFRTWTVDTIAPTATVNGPTPASATNPTLTNSKTPSFALTASEAATFECALDAPPPPVIPTFTACGPSYTTPSLADGTHTLQVRAKDAGGNFSPVTAKTFTVDATAPAVQFDLVPTDPSNSTDVTFQFSVIGDPTGTYTYQCKLDLDADFSPCTSPKAYTGLSDGTRNLQVKATDPAGNTSASVNCSTTNFPKCSTYRWTIDTKLPQTQIGSRPRPVTNATTATFDFQSPNTSPVTFECSRDGTAPEVCTSPKVYTGLTEGNHTFAVKAKSSSGVYDPDPAVYNWSIDTTAPDTAIGAAPPASTTSGFATFTFSSSSPGATFECKIDGSAWSDCPSTKIYGELTIGTHNFAVRAVDEAGNRDSTPATKVWTVLAPPPAAAAAGPSLINPFPVIRISGTITRRGVRLRLFLVNAPAGAKVMVRCRGKGCPFSKKSRAAKVFRMRTIEKKFYPAGVKLEVFVTKPGTIGKYTRFKIRRGKAPARTDRCLPVGSLKPTRCS